MKQHMDVLSVLPDVEEQLEIAKPPVGRLISITVQMSAQQAILPEVIRVYKVFAAASRNLAVLFVILRLDGGFGGGDAEEVVTRHDCDCKEHHHGENVCEHECNLRRAV